jgi:hypothetical protein
MNNERLKALADKHEIKLIDCIRLTALEKYEILILCDDSGSMNLTVDGTSKTRWNELRDIVKLVIEIGTIFDTDGVDVYFLNRKEKLKITDPKQIDHLFMDLPSGYTPLARVLQEVLQSSEARPDDEKKRLIFIATDGAPTDDDGNSDLNRFEHVMRSQRNANTTHVMFLLCTDESDYIDYLTRFKRTMKNIDVYDDYETEKKKIRRLHGSNYILSRGDYIVQALVGAVEHKT